MIPKNRIRQFMFQLMAKKKVTQMYHQAMENLKRHCEELAAQGKSHPYHIEIHSRQNKGVNEKSFAE
jgi:hypothetical protein